MLAATEDAEAALERVGNRLDPVRIATVRGVLAYVRMMTGDAPDRAARRLDEALSLARSAGDPWVDAAAHFGVAVAAVGRGASDVAMHHAQEILRISEDSGDRWSRFQTLQLTAGIFTRRGDYDASRAALTTSAQIAAAMGITDQVWILRSQRALVTMLAGDLERAEQQLTSVLEDAAREGQRIAFAHAARDRWDAASDAVASAVRHLPPEPVTTTHPLLLEAAAVAVVTEDPLLALRRLGRAAALREELGGVIVGGDRFDVDRVEARARQGIDVTTADAALEEGRSAEGLLPPIA